jgi:hypothetical protein
MGAINRVAELFGELPVGTLPESGAAVGDMPSGEMNRSAGGGMGGPGAGTAPTDAMPRGAMNGQTGTTPGAPTAATAASEGTAPGLTLQGEWRLTLSSLSLGRGR